ncbi:hypothetical protein BC834DRAFT_47470 [Gloeopeniophorella convolvens]|nr:hypothetical protein BC834DRAFT_47470 [Gloeopeniophorella convolvens]
MVPATGTTVSYELPSTVKSLDDSWLATFRTSAVISGLMAVMEVSLLARWQRPKTVADRWFRNITTINRLIDHLHDLASYVPSEHQSQLERQVDSLRTALKKQERRYIAFLRLSKDYADKYLLDISEDIQQQSLLLEALEGRLDMATSLRHRAAELHKSYEAGTMDEIEKLRRSGASFTASFIFRPAELQLPSSLSTSLGR